MSAVFPLEIILKCMNELSDDPAALKNCALVSTILHGASQALLFSTISIEVDAADSCRRVQQLSSSPRIVSYIRHLKICLDILGLSHWERWLTSEGQVLLDFLQLVPVAEIRSFSFRDFYERGRAITSLRPSDPPIAKALLQAIAQICAGPSLHTLEVAGMRSVVLLEACSASVQNLSVGDQRLDDHGYDVAIPDLILRILPIMLKNLELFFHAEEDCGIIDRYFLDPQSRINFRVLTHLHIFGSNNRYEEKVYGFLDHCRDSLETLVLGCRATGMYGSLSSEAERYAITELFSVIRPLQPLGLARLTKLKSLHLIYPFTSQEFRDRVNWFVDELMGLPESPSQLQHLAFTFMGWPRHDDPPLSMGPWDVLSSHLCQNALFPHLKCSKVSTMYWTHNGQEESPMYSMGETGLIELLPCVRELLHVGIYKCRYMVLEVGS
ncbi:hypothetical protein BKA70DRAFT_1290904 [Coprinopsis sp. MPI-PUGE-AT-0042]|nr:hypothetical protein BKA70DRAFT_1290904 [Coprinopsis sp. MPI-PUGE-AT-0042]